MEPFPYEYTHYQLHGTRAVTSSVRNCQLLNGSFVYQQVLPVDKEQSSSVEEPSPSQ